MTKKKGGLKMTNIYKFNEALKISWVKRYFDVRSKGKWKILFQREMSNIGGEWIWYCKPKLVTDFCYKKLCNTFLCEVIKLWFEFRIFYD